MNKPEFLSSGTKAPFSARYENFIGGQWVAPVAGRYFENTSPVTGRVICELDNPMRDPGDGTVVSATNISIVTYAGDGRWCRQEDVYNPLRFIATTVKWCRKAEALGTLPDEAAAWLRQYGGDR